MLNTEVKVRFSKSEKMALHKLAKRFNMNISQMIRFLVHDAICAMDGQPPVHHTTFTDDLRKLMANYGGAAELTAEFTEVERKTE